MFAQFINLYDLLLIPLVSLMPAGVISFLKFVTYFFGIFVTGKLLRWIWDILPVG